MWTKSDAWEREIERESEPFLANNIPNLCLDNFAIDCDRLIWNSTPMVDFESKQNSFFANLESIWLFPTSESPITTTLNT